MKCLLIGVVLCLASLSDQSALKCVPGTKGAPCPEVTEQRIGTNTEEENLPDGKNCATGTHWKNQCNDCSCNDGNPACTDKACPGQENELDSRCAPGSVWRDDCNTCWCVDGHAQCTRIGCTSMIITDFNPDRNDEGKNKTDSNKDNKTDQKIFFHDSDNNLDAVIKKEETRHNLVKRDNYESICKPKSSFKIDCNFCNCDDEGLSYTCTDNECVEEDSINKDVEVFMEPEGDVDHVERHSVCKASSTFYITCNSCRCNRDGTDYTCTNKPCPLPKDVELFHELRPSRVGGSENETKVIVCPAKRMFVKDCNTCWCNEEGTSYVCTRKVCVDNIDDVVQGEKQQPAKLKCKPDEVFQLDCNSCRCNSDGTAYSCTRRACPLIPVLEKDTHKTHRSRKVRAAQQETTKNCQPGQEFRMDCNKCLCDDEGQNYSCTRNDCTTPNNNNGGTKTKREISRPMKAECVPGSQFRQRCNTCHCTADGAHATCTVYQCKDDVEVIEPDSKGSFRCNPGEQFKRGCNDCTCSADGKDVFCTLRLCEQDITNIFMNVILILLVACFVDAALGEMGTAAEPRQLCVQSARVAGSCHTCVCDEQSIFRCKDTSECTNKTIVAGEKECEPEMTYNHQNLYCTCDEHGRWRSVNCKQTFKHMALQNVSKEMGKFGGIILTQENFKTEIEEGDPCVSGEVYTVDCNVCRCGPHNSLLCTKHTCVGRSRSDQNSTLRIKEGVPCVPGKLYKIDCNTCRCAADGNLVCTKMACLSLADFSKFKNAWKRKGIKQLLGKIHKANEQIKNTKNNKSLRKGDTAGIIKTKCTPGSMYKNQCEKCFCTAENKLICIEGECDKNNFLRSHIKNEEIEQLQKYKAARRRVPHIGAECEPGKLYKVDCNVCWCSAKRELSVCSRKYCYVSALDESKRLSGRHCLKNMSRGCVFCDCVNNVTKCDVKPNCPSPVEGNPSINGSAGDDFTLDTEKNKCIPNSTYSIHCNRCHCLEDGSLVCTSIACLTKSQVKRLENKIIKYGFK
ncbi:kielin/chordin-like protein [Aricia agestis]|uniref:kielin/chordin-like protein n=1 Tax=Aricia agestis TaxID=91739 RepID=UPI001C20C3EA|nr:kielin/chordin-like protein [Aricia agestis]